MGNRNTLRSSIEQARPSTAEPVHRETLRTAKTPSRFSVFSKEAKPRAPAPVPVAAPTKPSLKTSGLSKSRYASDSDDSPVAPRKPFRSRFEDSDDDDDGPITLPDLAPVRGIPRKPGREDGDSTDLDDESGDELGGLPSPKGKLTNGKEKGVKSGGSALAAGSMRMSGLERSKHAPVAPGISSPPASDAGAGEKPAKKEKRSFFGIGRKKKVPPVLQQPEPQDGVPGSPAGSERPKSPKLQRRNTPQSLMRIASGGTTDSWPLPPPPNFKHATDEERPSSADGRDMAPSAEAKERPDLGNRRSTVDGAVGLRFAEEDSVLGEGAGAGTPATKKKKKKFGALRRAFKLDD
jgi:serine/arginine repetitive matrix protein 2